MIYSDLVEGPQGKGVEGVLLREGEREAWVGGRRGGVVPNKGGEGSTEWGGAGEVVGRKGREGEGEGQGSEGGKVKEGGKVTGESGIGGRRARKRRGKEEKGR